MELYLVQHGAARSEAEDPQRSLTDDGRRTVDAVARHLARAGVRPARIEHSGKLRARQTAEILAAHLAPPGGAHEVSGLAPNDDIEAVRHRLEQETVDLMIVGHLPHLARLANRVLGLPAEPPLVRFQMGGVVCLGRDEGAGWTLRWMLVPALVTGA